MMTTPKADDYHLSLILFCATYVEGSIQIYPFIGHRKKLSMPLVLYKKRFIVLFDIVCIMALMLM